MCWTFLSIDVDVHAVGHVVSLQTFGDPYLAAVLIKKYLRELPEPSFTEAMYPHIRRCPLPSNDPTDMSTITYIRETLLPMLPHCSYILLNDIFREYFVVHMVPTQAELHFR